MPKIVSNVSIQTSEQGVLVDQVELQTLDGVTSNIQTQLNSKIPLTQKAQANGIAPLNQDSKVPLINLPSYQQEIGFGGNTVIYGVEPPAQLSIPVPISQGGTGSTTAGNALGTLGAQPSNIVLTGLTNVAGTGIIAYSSNTNGFFARSLDVTLPLTISNSQGINGNPTIGLNMGSGSNLNADLLDGLNSTSFMRKDQSDTINGNLTFTGATAGFTTSIINGRVWSGNNTLHLSPPNGKSVVINTAFRDAGGAAGGLAHLSVSGNVTAASYIVSGGSIKDLNKSHGSIRVTGSNGAYSGVYFEASDRTFMIHTGGSHSGIYHEGFGWEYVFWTGATSIMDLSKAPATASGQYNLRFGGTDRFFFRGDGYAWNAIQGWTPNWSDENLKREITPLTSCLDIVNQLNPVSYRWNSTAMISEIIGAVEDNDKHYGFTAQQIQPIIEDIVKPGPSEVDGDQTYLTYEKTEIIPFLTGAIQELHARLISIEQRLDIIEAGI